MPNLETFHFDYSEVEVKRSPLYMFECIFLLHDAIKENI